MTEHKRPFRIQPSITPETQHFWTGGEDGKLHLLHCQDCDTWIHPPQPICPACTKKNLKPDPVSGRGTVYSYTINRQAWIPGFDPPYIVAIVELEEDARVRLMTNIIHCNIDKVHIGMKVKVWFEEQEGGVVYMPLFEPV